MSKWSFSLLVKYHHWGMHHFQTKPNMEIIRSNNISRTENLVQTTIITYHTQWGALFTILIKFVYNSNNYDLWYLQHLITIELMQPITQQTLRVGAPHCWGFSDWLVSEALYSMDETSSSIFLWYHGGRLTRAMRLTSALLRESAFWHRSCAAKNADAEDEWLKRQSRLRHTQGLIIGVNLIQIWETCVVQSGFRIGRLL